MTSNISLESRRSTSALNSDVKLLVPQKVTMRSNEVEDNSLRSAVIRVSRSEAVWDGTWARVECEALSGAPLVGMTLVAESETTGASVAVFIVLSVENVAPAGHTFHLTLKQLVEPETERERSNGLVTSLLARGSKHYLQFLPQDAAT